jgi:hypothetical protein
VLFCWVIRHLDELAVSCIKIFNEIRQIFSVQKAFFNPYKRRNGYVLMKTFQVKVKTQYRFARNVNIIMLFEKNLI